MVPGSRNSSPVLVPRQRSAALRLLVFFLFLALPPCSSTPRDRFLQASGPMQPATNGTAPLAPTATLCRLDDLIDATLLPDFWNNAGVIDPRIRTNGDTPEQLVKVTDRRHRFPVFATVCSLAFLLTIIAIIVVCTH